MGLTAPERETVILFSDDSEMATVHTHQRKIITKLNNNPAATKVEDISHGGTPGAVFELPADRISFRGPKSKRERSAAQKANTRNLAEKARELAQKAA